MMFGQAIAQTSFYFRPVFETKADFASTNAYRYSDHIFNNNSYFQYDNLGIKNSFHDFSLTMGGFVGMKSKNSSYLLELGLVGDQSQSGFKLNFMSKDLPTNTYYPNSISLVNGRAFKRLTFQSSILINQKSDKKQKYYFISGLSFGFKPPAPSFGNLDSNVQLITLENNIVLKNETGLYSEFTKFYFGHIGFSVEIHSKNRYLFDITLFVNKSFNRNHTISHVTSTITILENNVEKEKYAFSSWSKGSGIILQLSRKFQFYPKKSRK